MPTTPVHALPYPAAADPADVPLDMQELAERVDTVVPPPGTAAGQVAVWDGTKWIAQAPATWSCVLWRANQFQVASGTEVWIPWGGTVYDTATPPMWDLAAATHIYCRKSGLYRVTCRCEFLPNVTGVRYLRIVYSGGGYHDIARAPGYGVMPSPLLAIAELAMVAGQYITCNVYQDSGVALNLNASSQAENMHCSVTRIGDTA
jgi:hypothetical protein